MISLVVMAAGMGSRFGGLKQIEPVDNQGNIIMDFSVYDAYRAGFDRIIFVIKREMEETFKEKIIARLPRDIDVKYVFQDISDIPIGYTVPNGRVKPWGTGHAVMSAKKYIDGPFCVINADDYYGKNAFKLMYDYLNADEDRYGMVGYVLNNTLTDNGYVSRGVCAVDNENNLVSVVENTHIERKNGKIVNIGEIETILDENATVSMNMWGFPKKFMQKLHDGFAPFLDKGLVENPIKCEYFLPFVVDDLIKKNEVSVKVLNTPDRWYGVTYKEDKDTVCNAIKKLKEDKVYPEKLW